MIILTSRRLQARLKFRELEKKLFQKLKPFHLVDDTHSVPLWCTPPNGYGGAVRINFEGAVFGLPNFDHASLPRTKLNILTKAVVGSCRCGLSSIPAALCSFWSTGDIFPKRCVDPNDVAFDTYCKNTSKHITPSCATPIIIF